METEAVASEEERAGRLGLDQPAVRALGGILASIYCFFATNTRKSSSVVASLSRSMWRRKSGS